MVTNATTVHRLKVCGGGLDPLLTQLRTANLFDRIDLQPRGLPPEAILCIRALRDPMPRTLRLETNGIPAAIWQQSMRSQVDELVAKAVRPLYDHVPSPAEAVLFNDRAELLACLAMDWVAGQLASHWWWKGLLKGDLSLALLAAWREAPDYVPNAFGHLVHTEQAIAFLRALPQAETQILLGIMIRQYKLVELQSILEAEAALSSTDSPPETGPSNMVSPESSRPQQTPSFTNQTSDAPPTISPPWGRWVPSQAPQMLTITSQMLLGVGLTLLQQPNAVRTTRFATEVRHWLAANESPATITLSKYEEPQVPVLSELFAESLDLNTVLIPVQFQAAEEVQQTGVLTHDAASTDPLAVEDSLPVQAEVASTAGSTHEDEPQSIPTDTFSPAEIVPEVADFRSQSRIEINTAYGGIFYLINAGLGLGLYGDFTQPRSPGISLSPWDFLALMGEWFVGVDLLADPIWTLLATLSGRGDLPPGYDFEAPESWYIPLDWLDAFPETNDWRWSSSDGRLVVWHPAGFWVVDEPIQDELDLQVQEVFKTYNIHAKLNATPVAKGEGLLRWCEWIANFLRARLFRALDVDNHEALVTTLLRHSAHVVISAARLDITLDLNSLPVEVRFAGLDRDPYWVPATGRSIAFHFEV